MTRLLALCVALALAAGVALALTFPPLSGRIVDQANIIPQQTRDALEPKLAELEQKSGIQLVVATVNTLEGQEIEPYANELFRFWKLGEKNKNNGVLLLVAPKERRVRIEVGYGLEGTLTDALSAVIIANAITPRFKTGDYSGGITRGVDDIITVLTTDESEWQKRPSLRLDRPQAAHPTNWVGLLALGAFLVLLVVSPGFRTMVFAMLLTGRGGLAAAAAGGAAGSAAAAAAGWRRLLGRRRLVRRRRRQRPMVGAMAADEPVDLSPQDRQRISAAIQAAERRTTGEIVCVLARHSAESTALPILLAALAALALPWLLVGLTTLPVLIILSLQLALFVGLAAMLSVPRVRVGLLPKATRQAIAHRAAMEQFMLRGIGRTEGRTGVLVFVSLAERYARIVADEAIASRVAQADWQSAIDALVDHMRRGRIADGFVEAIERCGGVLATHFPAKADERSELPDRIYLI